MDGRMTFMEIFEKRCSDELGPENRRPDCPGDGWKFVAFGKPEGLPNDIRGNFAMPAIDALRRKFGENLLWDIRDTGSEVGLWAKAA